MKLPRLSLLIGFLLLPAWLAAAPGPVRKGAVTAELVAAQSSIQPGRTFRVALKLNHDEHWHSYWINPGTGYPTSLEWKLPAGFTAGPILWSTPHVVQDTRGHITGHGYEGEVYLFVELTAPGTLTPGETVTLRAKADWLMCKEVCMPGMADLELTLPVATESSSANAALAQAWADLPQPLAGWSTTAVRAGSTLTVRLTPAAGTTHRPQNLHLFDTAGLADFAAAQTITEEQGSLVFTLPIAKDAPADATRLTGVLVSKNGWGPMSPSRGATFDIALGSEVGRVVPNAPSSASHASPLTPPPSAKGTLAGTLLLAFVGGLILNLMPCVFPVLGIKVLGFVNQSGTDRRKVITHGVVFSLGVLLSFWVLVALLLALRVGGQSVGWGFQLQDPRFVYVVAAVMLALGMNLSGVFEIGLSATGVGGKLQLQSGYSGSFFTGVLATVVATPCSGPFLGSALGASLTLGTGETFVLFTCIALGLALPYLLLSLFPAAVKFLPRPGAWMETFKQFMAFPMYATVGWLLWVLASQVREPDNALLLIAFGLVLVAMAAWAYGRFGTPTGRLAAAVLLLAGIGLGWPKSFEPVPAIGAGYSVRWEHWSPEAVAAARTAGRTVYVDFTARWCATCQTNKAAVFTSGAVLAELAKRNVLLLKADWTSRDPAITAELARWGRTAVPFNLIYAPGRADPVILPELLTPGRVLEALNR